MPKIPDIPPVPEEVPASSGGKQEPVVSLVLSVLGILCAGAGTAGGFFAVFTWFGLALSILALFLLVKEKKRETPVTAGLVLALIALSLSAFVLAGYVSNGLQSMFVRFSQPRSYYDSYYYDPYEDWYDGYDDWGGFDTYYWN